MSQGEDQRFLVVTEHGRVMVRVRSGRSGLDGDLIEVTRPDEAALTGLSMETPLRAFAAKMVDIVQARGAGDVPVSATMLELLVKEKAAEDLTRIERTARRLYAEG